MVAVVEVIVAVVEVVVWATVEDQLSMVHGLSSMQDVVNLMWAPNNLALLIVLLVGNLQRRLNHYL